jgi:transposase-like protein
MVQDGESLSSVANELGLQPPLLIAWRKQFFAHAATAFERPQDKELAKAREDAARLESKIASLEADKDRIIAAVATEVCELKKKLSAMPSKPGAGSSRMSGTKSSPGVGGSRR